MTLQLGIGNNNNNSLFSRLNLCMLLHVGFNLGDCGDTILVMYRGNNSNVGGSVEIMSWAGAAMSSGELFGVQFCSR